MVVCESDSAIAFIRLLSIFVASSLSISFPLLTLSKALARSKRTRNAYGRSFWSIFSSLLSLITFSLLARYCSSSSMLV